MPEISSITLPSGTTYTIKDATARAAVVGGLALLGITTTALSDGATTNPIKINGSDVTAVNGNIAIYSNKEFVFVVSGSTSKWYEFGDTGNLGDLAYKDSASGNYTPAGNITISSSAAAQGNPANYTPAGVIAAQDFTGSATVSQGAFTPSGTITISTGTGTANYTPSGTVSKPVLTVTPSTVSKYVAASATGGGSVTAGSAASCTLPVLTTSVSNETLTIGWSAGSFTANTPTAVTLPSFSQQTIATGISQATSTQPTFTGIGTELKGTFAGTEGTVSVTGTPAGTVSRATFTGTGTRLTGSFLGTSATITVQ